MEVECTAKEGVESAGAGEGEGQVAERQGVQGGAMVEEVRVEGAKVGGGVPGEGKAREGGKGQEAGCQ